MHTMVKMVFGSHLYGLDTENSDKDYRGIFVPTAKEIILGSMKEHYDQSTSGQGIKNTKDDIDVNMFSLKKVYQSGHVKKVILALLTWCTLLVTC